MTHRNPNEGTIVTEAPNQMWGADATATFTEAEGAVTVFAAIDHCTAECVGIHVVKRATRFEALEPIRQGVKEYFAGFSAGSAGLRLRHDHGSVYMSDDFQCEIQFLGIEPSPAFVRQPEGNGCIVSFQQACVARKHRPSTPGRHHSLVANQMENDWNLTSAVDTVERRV